MTTSQYIALTLPLCTLLLAGAFVVCARWRPAQQDLPWMALGFVLFSVGVASQILQIPQGLDDSAVLSAAIYHVSVGCVAQAVALRHKVRMHSVLGGLMAAGALAALAYYAYVDYDLNARIYILNFGLGTQLAVSSWQVWRVRPRDALERALWWLFGIFVASFFVRTVLTIPQAHGLTDASFAHTPFWIALYLSLLVFALLFAMLYVGAAVRDAVAQLQQERNRDALTQLLNRRAFLEALDHPTHATPLGALLLIDIDYFKSINDQWGHAAGDAVLQRVAQILLQHVRAQDLVARYGGEEFVVLLRGLTPAQAVQVAQRIQTELASSHFPSLPSDGLITVSCGIAALEHLSQLQHALQQADGRLYAAKSGGRNCVRWSDPLPETWGIKPQAPLNESDAQAVLDVESR
jgi:diguanylate cyclase